MKNQIKILNFICQSNQAELIADWLMENEALSVTLKDAKEEAIFVEAVAQMPLWQTVNIEAQFGESIALEEIKQKLSHEFAIDPASYIESQLADNDWEKNFRQYFQPQCFAGRFWVYPQWITEDLQESHMILEPGLAFGTGTHPTTKLCLNYLAQQDLTNKIVVDYGCGSGILAIAAVKLGAKKVYAVDHDPQALEATRNNAALNQIGDSLTIIKAEEMPKIEADLIVANIFSSVLIALCEKLACYVKHEGICALSGILLAQLKEVEQPYLNYFKKKSELIEEGWVMMVLKKDR